MTDGAPQFPLPGMVQAGHLHMTLLELSMACGLPVDGILDLVLEGVLDPFGDSREQWHFDESHLRCVGISIRLQRDLGLNLPGVALVLQLLEELQSLRQVQTYPG